MTTPAKTTAYTQCEQCGFWHAPDEPHCANCGISLVKEYEKVCTSLEEEYADKGKGCGCLTGLIGFAIGCRLVDQHYGNDYPIIIIFLWLMPIWGMFLFAFIGTLIGSKKIITKKVLAAPKVVAQGLRQNEELINQRLGEIGQKEQKIYAMAEELKQQGDPQRNRVRFQALDKGSAELSRQRDRYAGKLREIELIRWSNQLSPMLSHSSQLTEQQATERLNTLSNIQTQGQKLAQTWRQTPLSDDETRCADRLNQALTTCDQLRQDLLDLKTALAVGDISAFDGEQRSSEAALELLDLFNALPDVGGFTAGFKKLEDEYFRLQSEDEVRQFTK